MIKIHKLPLVALALCLSLSAFAQDTAIKEAEAAYANERYNEAIEQYEKILDTYGESAEVRYNLGNACYKAGQTARAILHYERALLLDPGDADIRFNLQLAKGKAVDKIEPLGKFFLTEWFHFIENKGSADSWGKLGIFCFILLMGCLLLFFFSRRTIGKKTGFYAGILLLAAVIFANIFAANQRRELTDKARAIVFAPTVTVKSSPDASGTDLFILHEGTGVTIKNTLGDWKEIELEDGNTGWLPAKDIETI